MFGHMIVSYGDQWFSRANMAIIDATILTDADRRYVRGELEKLRGPSGLS